MLLPHNKDPDRFDVPSTWRRADVESNIPTAMPSVADIRRSMGADEEKAKQLYNEFADYAAQRLSEYDRRDREHLDNICASVEEIMAGMRMKRIEQNDYVYISMRAPPHFRSCTMFNEAEKRARMKELLYDNTSYKERLHELRRENQKDMPERKGYVADAVKNIQAMQDSPATPVPLKAPPPPAPSRDPPVPPPMQSTPGGEAPLPAACAAAGPAYNDTARFEAPPAAACAAAGPAYNDAARFGTPPGQGIPPHYYPPRTRGPPKAPPPALKKEYKIEPQSDADRGPQPDAATLDKNVRFKEQP